MTYAVGWKLDKELTPFIEAYNLLHITVISVSVTYQYACMPLEPTYRGDFKEIVMQLLYVCGYISGCTQDEVNG